MTWTLKVLHRFPTDMLADVGAYAHELPLDEREVTRQLAVNARLDGFLSAGEFVDHLAGLDASGRRDLLDRARADIGLEPTGVVDAREAASKGIKGDWRVQCCHAPGCNVFPTTDSGSMRLVEVRRWHCSEHLHLAEPGDMDAPVTWRYSPSGAMVPVSEGLDPESITRRAELEARDQENRAAAAEMAESERALDERMRRETPPGVLP
jgi:hypothetical protein